MEHYMKNYVFKILMLGDCGVGKTCLLQRFLENRYTEDHKGTLGLDYQTHIHKIAGHLVELQLWDTAGEERYRSLGSTYYRGAQGIILVYDITQRKSFCNLDDWLQDIQQYAANNVKILIVGNKSDDDEHRQVSEQSTSVWASLLELLYYEASAKDGTNVYEIFTSMAVMLYNRSISTIDLSHNLPEMPIETDDSVNLSDFFDPEAMQRSPCCISIDFNS